MFNLYSLNFLSKEHQAQYEKFIAKRAFQELTIASLYGVVRKILSRAYLVINLV